MKKIYNSSNGRTCRPRKTARPIGVMSQELRKEIKELSQSEGAQFHLVAMIGLVNLGVDVFKLSIH